MNRIAKFIIRYRLIIGVLILIITLFLGFEATKIKINPDIVSYFPNPIRLSRHLIQSVAISEVTR